MDRILVATDFSTRSMRALQRAARLARAHGSFLTVVHVVDDDQPEQIIEQEVRASEDFLREQLQSLQELRGIRCHAEIAKGDPFDGILRTAESSRTDLIVMGAHRKQLLRDVFVGTTIERVIRTGPFPVLMVNRSSDKNYSLVLAAVDLSDASAQALQTADKLKFLEDADVRIAHAFIAVGKGKMYVADAPPERIAAYVDEEERRTDADLAAFLGEAGFRDRAWRRHLWEGTAAEVVSSAVETLGPELVVLGTHARSGIAKFLLGSVSETLLRTLDTDILAVPPFR